MVNLYFFYWILLVIFFNCVELNFKEWIVILVYELIFSRLCWFYWVKEIDGIVNLVIKSYFLFNLLNILEINCLLE